ncbi:dTDP-4-dehydrorhamnose 3,5-epimerase [Ottowia sp.]|uniref:dTDP-4-dehydrorhamnose 3,5-epimerase n=1 Tax=Ottowia sp. TaxID=1898956 RepID=UPI0025EBFB06|nr:dTDP-4-dehydrorhamnose 3,5-epimerase [Ottowia sp.]MBK6616593.1 dTDP-4-dehydrorhamnose 3,5-epimerase [Ottowia sp.]
MRYHGDCLPGMLIVPGASFSDERGWFKEAFSERRFREALAVAGLGLAPAFVQDNVSRSGVGVLRGLHFQSAPAAQGKLVSVLQGRVFDVGVDMRPSSAHFGDWSSMELSRENGLSLWIPPGFAHGFVALEEGTILSYKVTCAYAAEHERAIRWDDEDLAIEWPTVVAARAGFVMSTKDRTAPSFRSAVADIRKCGELES